MKNSTIIKIMRNWWNYNGMKENSIPLSGNSMGKRLFNGIFKWNFNEIY